MTPSPSDTHHKNKTFFGKYRGTVSNNIDPQGLGRLQVAVPSVLGPAANAWAMPCLPIAGPQAGILALPPIGASVWVEFEAGDPGSPIWVGGFWPQAGEMPQMQPDPASAALMLSAGGASLVIDRNGIALRSGGGASITLQGPEVSVNAGALVVV
ncbi:MAG: baseplate assembly protein [Rhodospirillaceae bacterium]|nr:MAG: baseplate assembly protein [Rhodospirillaceae bacterium]